uniref:Uncharacterized protein n=1 Tax=uncultured Nocardioidaceae bacterium TaxID=253824 RepID=A0A6J4LPM2_9ACTN|nr:MAG: hypothetical protein AVDCRST_MAG46-1840 [uncultured Nocardioidaceae bacterium]
MTLMNAAAVEQLYGYREYSTRDAEGRPWSFMKPLGSVDQ